jgi:hypothetical protein
MHRSKASILYSSHTTGGGLQWKEGEISYSNIQIGEEDVTDMP